jgi:hypothetical protein
VVNSVLLFAALSMSVGATDVVREGARGICDGIEQIREIPIKKGWPVEDRIYNQLVSSGSDAASCLVAKIVDETPMPDPRQEPTKQADFKVGDLAFFLLLDLDALQYDAVLPPHLASASVQEYFQWVNLPGNRRKLQDNCAKAIGVKYAIPKYAIPGSGLAK